MWTKDSHNAGNFICANMYKYNKVYDVYGYEEQGIL